MAIEAEECPKAKDVNDHACSLHSIIKEKIGRVLMSPCVANYHNLQIRGYTVDVPQRAVQAELQGVADSHKLNSHIALVIRRR